MKKYLFLLFLFIIYIILTITNKSIPTLSYDSLKKDGVSEFNILFNNGINSNDIIKIFDKYDDEYYINYIKLKNDNEYKLSCSNIKECIKNIYDQEDLSFNIENIANGINISDINLIGYTKNTEKFLQENNIYYNIN